MYVIGNMVCLSAEVPLADGGKLNGDNNIIYNNDNDKIITTKL